MVRPPVIPKNSVFIYAAAVFSLSVLLCMVPVSFAEECFTDLDTDRASLERALEKCQEQIEISERKLKEQNTERKGTESAILLISTEINKALLRIRRSDITIGELGKEIGGKEETLEELKVLLQKHRDSLKILLQRINELEQKDFVNFLFSNLTLSSFFFPGE